MAARFATTSIFAFKRPVKPNWCWKSAKASGEDWELQIERGEGEDFGLSFEQIVPRQCANECIFCFCKGNPADARPSLFIRDEDVRLSFLYGNYTTLTSITEDEMRRIVEQRLSPQYVSVHATDLDVRAYLLGVDKERADIAPKAETRCWMPASRFTRRSCFVRESTTARMLRTDDCAIWRRSIRASPASRSFRSGLTRYNTDPRLTAVTPEFLPANNC